jgi:chromosome segregation ATPase
MEEKKTYQAMFKKQLKELSESLAELTFRVEQFQDDAEVEYHAQIESLRDKQHRVREKLEELEEASDEAWEDINDGIEHAWSDLKKSLDSAWSRFKSDPKT